jgi:tRNA 2-thiocytidine biosynthesis protein TtcA
LDRRAIEAGEKPRPKWLVCLSGGKDSYGLLAVLMDLQWQGALPVDLIACNLDQGQPGFPKHVLPDWLAAVGVPFKIITEDTYSIVTEKVEAGRTYCSMCSRLRRGILYRVAREEGCEAIVLGHHRDDALETFMMNLVHGGRLAAMPPKLLSEDGRHVVIRPLAYVPEREIDRDGTIRSSLSDPFSNTPTSLDPAPAASSAEAPAPETAAVEAPAQAALAEPDDGTPAFIPPAIAHPPEIPEFLPPGTGRA